jgi:high-affinity nickel-transport protein
MEFAVAIVLILLGTGSAARLLRMIVAPNPGRRLTKQEAIVVRSHQHDSGALHHNPHVHHDHHLARLSKAGVAARYPLLRSFSVGLVHGLAGSAAIALVVLSAIPQPMWATIYLAIFCVGTIIGMALITTAIGAPFMFASQRMVRAHQMLVMGSGLLSVGFGFFLAWQIGITDHLFGIAPIWIPH